MALNDPSVTQGYPSNDQSRISALPTECKIAIIDYLSAQTVINLRLTSLAWREVCVRGLFNVSRSRGRIIERGVLSIRSYRDDMTRLQDISNRPWLARYIRHIEVYAGPYLQTNHVGLFANCLREHRMEIRMRDYCLTDLDIWCNVYIMSESFPRLHGIDSLTIAAGRWCPFDDTENCPTWLELERECVRYTDSEQQLSAKVYKNIIEAACRGLRYPLRSLEVGCLPIQSVVESDRYGPHLVILKEMVPRLRTLRIASLPTRSFDRDEEIYGAGLESLLQLALNLQSLDLRWQGSNPERMKWKKSFYKNTWPHLHSLRMSEVVTDQKTIYKFLTRHKRSLRNLSIDHCTEEYSNYQHNVFNGSTRAMLTKLRDEFHLEKFQMMLNGDTAIYDENWIPLSSHSVLDTNWSARGVDPPETARLLEAYVRGECDWPMVNDRPPPLAKRWYRMPKWQQRIPGFAESANLGVDEIDMMYRSPSP